MKNILITDPLSEKALSLFQDAGFEILYEPNITEDEKSKILKNINGWVVRSGTKVKSDDIKRATNLQIIGRAGVGVDNIDIEQATLNGVVVVNVPDGNTVSAAEHTVAMLLSLSRNIEKGHSSLAVGKWDRHKLTGSELQGKILGVVGLGKIGREVIKRASSFDMKILGFDPYVKQSQFDDKEIKVVSLDELTKNSDYITLHVPINDNTRNLFNLDRIKMMKSSSRIINVARGGIINEKDLATALNNEIIAGAAIDVFVSEPLDTKSPLIGANNILLTPHLGASTFEAKESVSNSICQQIIDYFNEEKLSNPLNMPVVDQSLIKKMSPFYNLSEKIGVIISQLVDSPIDSIEVICYGEAEDSKSISLLFIKGLLANMTDNRINMINADVIAKERGIIYTHSYNNEETPYLNLIKCKIKAGNQLIDVSGSVYFENHLRIVNIMGFEIDLDPSGTMLFIKNKDVPGVIGKIGTVLGNLNVNIAGYLLSRIEQKDFAYAVIKIDNLISNSVIEELEQINEIIEIKQLNV